MSDLRYGIVETFYSIQGEGYWAGTPAFFIRFAGCNLSCKFCDTDIHMKEQLTVTELYDRIPWHHLRRGAMLVLTGGEPTLQELFPLMNMIRSKKHTESSRNVFVALETNGIWKHDPGSLLIDWITFSPKLQQYPSAMQASEIKIVLQEELDPMIFLDKSAYKFNHYFIQPQSEDFEPAINYVKENPIWRLSIQTQKTLNIS